MKMQDVASAISKIAKKLTGSDVSFVKDSSRERASSTDRFFFELDMDKARNELSWNPRYGFEEAIEKAFGEKLK